MSQSYEASWKSPLALKGAGPLGCPICHIQFLTPEERIRHAREKHKVHKSKFPCEACKVTGFSSPYSLQNHIERKCIGAGWEKHILKASKAAITDVMTFRRSSLRFNSEDTDKDTDKSSKLTPIAESLDVNSVIPPRKRKMSATIEKPAKIPRKHSKSVESDSKIVETSDIIIDIEEGLKYGGTSIRKSRRNSSSETNSESSRLMKTRKTTPLLIDESKLYASHRPSVANAIPVNEDTKVEASNLRIFSEAHGSGPTNKASLLRNRRESTIISNREFKSNYTKINTKRQKTASENTLTGTKSRSLKPNHKDVEVTEKSSLSKVRRNIMGEFKQGSSSLVSQSFRKGSDDKSPEATQGMSSMEEIFSSKSRRVSTKIPKKYLMSTEFLRSNNDGIEQAKEEQIISKFTAFGVVVQKESARNASQGKSDISEDKFSINRTRNSSTDVSNDASKSTSENLSEPLAVSSNLSDKPESFIASSDDKKVPSSKDFEENDGGNVKTLSTASTKPLLSSLHSDFYLLDSEKPVVKRRLTQTGSEKGTSRPTKKSQSPQAANFKARMPLKTKPITEYFQDSALKTFKDKISSISNCKSSKSLDFTSDISRNASEDCRLGTIVEEKFNSLNDFEENSSRSAFNDLHSSLSLSNEHRQSEVVDTLKFSQSHNKTCTEIGDMELSLGLDTSSDFTKEKNAKISEKSGKVIIKNLLNITNRTSGVKASSSFVKANEPSTPPESTDPSLDAKRLELKLLRESLGLDFSHTPRTYTSSGSSNTSGSPIVVSPRTPNAKPSGVCSSKFQRSSSNPSTPTPATTSKGAEKLALLDWDSFIAKSKRKSRPSTKIKQIISHKSPVSPNSAENLGAKSCNKEVDNSLDHAADPMITTSEGNSFKNLDAKPNTNLQDYEMKPSKSPDVRTAATDSPSTSEISSPFLKPKGVEACDSGSKSMKVVANDLDMSTEDVAEKSISLKATEEIKFEKEELNFVGEVPQVSEIPPNSTPQEVVKTPDALKDDDDSSESTVPCMESDSDKSSAQNSPMSMLSCPVCHLGGFATKAELKVHLTVSCQEEEPQKNKKGKKRKRPIEWYCPGCPRSFGPFGSAKALLDHLPTCHIKRVAYLNGESRAGKGRGRPSQLDPNDMPLWPAPLPSTPVTYGCPVCGCFFATASRLDQHRSEADHFQVVGRFLKTNGYLKAHN